MERYVYVGTYTQDILFGTGAVLHGKGEGIYRLRQDVATGILSTDVTWKGIENPSFLALNKVGDRLYAVNELKTYLNQFGGSVSAFGIQKDQLIPLGRVATGGTDPCHVALGKNERVLYVANFMSGSVSVFSLDKDGALIERVQFIQHEGNSIHPNRQRGPHAHSVILKDNCAYVPDLGLDAVLCYRIAPDGTLTENVDQRFWSTPGNGPRHLCFGKQYAYVINELSSSISVVRFDGIHGPKQLSIHSTLPKGCSQVQTSCACIRLNKAETFLYASNRGHDSITVFRVIGDTLEQAGCYSCHGAIPRDFTITQDDRFLICANQNSDTLTVFALDADTGALHLRQIFDLPTPVCVITTD